MMSTSTGDFYAGKFLSYHWRSIISRRVPVFNNLSSKGMLRDANSNGNFSFDINGLSQPTSRSPAIACLILWFSGQFICTPGPFSFLKHDLFCMATFGMQLRSHVSVSFSPILFDFEKDFPKLRFVNNLLNSIFLNNFKSPKLSSLEFLGLKIPFSIKFGRLFFSFLFFLACHFRIFFVFFKNVLK